MTDTPTTPGDVKPSSLVPLPGPVASLASLGNLGQTGALLAAVGLMWARIDAIEARFDRIEIQIDELSRSVVEMSTMMQVQTARTVSAEDFIDLERRVTILEAR
jgi:hypothetical protein